MRRFAAVVVLSVLGGACSRPAPSHEAKHEPPPPVAKEDRAPSLHLAAAVVTTPKAPLIERAPAPEPPTPPEPPSLEGKTVLHVGDSMVGGSEGLSRALRERFKAEGAKYVREYKVSESLASFDRSPRLRDLIGAHHPDIVLVTLGSNDALVPYPKALAHHVRHIVGRIGARECYWIGPPMWTKDRGIVDMLRENVAPCTFYDSSDLTLSRKRDGIHPNEKGGAAWAASFWTFFRESEASARARDAGVHL